MTFNSQDLQAEKPPQKHSRPCSVVFCSQVWARTKPPSQLWVCSPGFIPLLLIILEIYPFSSTWPCCCPLCRAALSGELRAESHGCLQRAAQKPGGQLKVGKNKTDPKNDAWLVCKCWPGMRGEHPDSTRLQQANCGCAQTGRNVPILSVLPLGRNWRCLVV